MAKVFFSVVFSLVFEYVAVCADVSDSEPVLSMESDHLVQIGATHRFGQHMGDADYGEELEIRMGKSGQRPGSTCPPCGAGETSDEETVGDYDEGSDTGKGKGKSGKTQPLSCPPCVVPAPTPAPITPMPTPPYTECQKYTGSEEVPAGQLPYIGMTSCMDSSFTLLPHTVVLTNKVRIYAGTTTSRYTRNPKEATCMNTDHVKPGKAGNKWWFVLNETSTVGSVELTGGSDKAVSRYFRNVDILVGGKLCANVDFLPYLQTVRFNCTTPLRGNEIMLSPHHEHWNYICGFGAFEP